MQPYFYKVLDYLRSIMYLFNLTVIIEPDQEHGIVRMIQEILSAYGPSQDNTGRIRLLKMIDSKHEGLTYCLQFQVAEVDSATEIQENKLFPLQSRLENDFPGKVFFFESMMQYID